MRSLIIIAVLVAFASAIPSQLQLQPLGRSSVRLNWRQEFDPALKGFTIHYHNGDERNPEWHTKTVWDARASEATIDGLNSAGEYSFCVRSIMTGRVCACSDMIHVNLANGAVSSDEQLRYQQQAAHQAGHQQPAPGYPQGQAGGQPGQPGQPQPGYPQPGQAQAGYYPGYPPSGQPGQGQPGYPGYYQPGQPSGPQLGHEQPAHGQPSRGQAGHQQSGYQQGGYDQHGQQQHGGYQQGQSGHHQEVHQQGGYQQGGYEQHGQGQHGGYQQGGHQQAVAGAATLSAIDTGAIGGDYVQLRWRYDGPKPVKYLITYRGFNRVETSEGRWEEHEVDSGSPIELDVDYYVVHGLRPETAYVFEVVAVDETTRRPISRPQSIRVTTKGAFVK